MTNRRDRSFFSPASLQRAAVLGLVIVAGLGLPGCEKKQPAPQQAAPPPPPPKPVASLEGVKLHEKVQFPDVVLPSSQEAVEAIASLAGALASGDAAAMQRLLSERDQAVLKTLVDSGEWERQSQSTQAVRVVNITEEGGTVRVGLAVEDSLGAYLTGWEATESGDAWVFSGMAIAPRMGIAAADLDGAELTPLELPKGTAASSMALRAAEPPPRVVREQQNRNRSSGGGNPNRRVPATPM